MKIETVDFFYLAMPEVTEAVDGSQDALVVRVRAGGHEGWGECEAAPLVSIASFVCPRSHGACRPVSDSVLGQRLDEPADIGRIGDLVRQQSLDLLQADHTLSGIDIALWDLLGKRLGEPVWRLLGYDRAHPKLPYASQLFGATPEATEAQARRSRAAGFRAVKFGWAPFGTGSVAADAAQLEAARAGLGPEGILLIDAGTVWLDDGQAAAARLPALEAAGAMWLEEPFVSGALDAYYTLSLKTSSVKLAGGEGCHDYFLAKTMIDHAGLGFIQIDAGRIGGISPAKRIADYAAARGVKFVNHTFTSDLALSASLQPYAGLADHDICEYPVDPKPVAAEMSRTRLTPDADGLLHLPEGPGLGVALDYTAMGRYLVEAEIAVGGEVLYRTPPLPT